MDERSISLRDIRCFHLMIVGLYFALFYGLPTYLASVQASTWLRLVSQFKELIPWLS